MNPQELLKAFESLDTELLYAAHAEPKRRRRPDGRRLMIAAAIMLLLIGTAVSYGVFIAPVSSVCLDSRESVTITLNSRGNVLSAGSYTQLSGRSAAYAVGTIAEDMLNNGAIDEDENTLLIGTDGLSEEARDSLFDAVLDVYTASRFHGAIVSLSCSDTDARSAVIQLLAKSVDAFSVENLRTLSANDLNILLHEYGVTDGISFSGTPSENGYIGKPAAMARAVRMTSLNDADISVTYSVCYSRLVYLVRIIGDDRAEAYFINAADGTVETVLKTTPEQLESAIQSTVKVSNLPMPDAPSTYSAVPDVTQSVATDAATAPTQSASSSTAAQSALSTTAAPTPSASPSTEPVTAAPTQPPIEAVQMKSLSADITYEDQVYIFDMTLEDFDDGSFGAQIPFYPMNNYTKKTDLSLSNYSKSEVKEIGQQDRHIAMYGSHADFIHDTFANLSYDSDYGEYLTHLIADNGIDEDYFDENAIIMLTYYDNTVYQDEEDSFCAISVNDSTMYVDLLRKGEETESVTDLCQVVIPVTVKKEDVKNITEFRLLLTKQV